METICKLKDLYKAFYSFKKQFFNQAGVTINEAALLCCLKEGTPKSANELSEFVGLSCSRVSRIINSMEKKELIVRNIGNVDKRQMIFTLSKEGKDKMNEMRKRQIDLDSFMEQLIALSKQ